MVVWVREREGMLEVTAKTLMLAELLFGTERTEKAVMY